MTHTDFPEPVAPAIKRCGVCAISIVCSLPVISLPSKTGTAIFASCGTSVSINSRILTIARFAFGTSIPTASFPGIGATIRTLGAASLNAMLSCNPVILESFIPGGGISSNIVTTGPFVMPLISTSILNSCKVSFKIRASRRVSSSTIQY